MQDGVFLTKKFNGKKIDVCGKRVRDYINAETEKEICDILVDWAEDYSSDELTARWRGNSREYKVHISKFPDFSREMVFETQNEYFSLGFLTPCITYYYKITDWDGNASETDSFNIKGDIRLIALAGFVNARDLGGYKTIDGKKVKYGFLYRGANPNQEFDEKTVKTALHIKTELDLRSSGRDDGGQTGTRFGKDVSYVKINMPGSGYCFILPDFNQKQPYERRFIESSLNSVKEIFTLLADEKNYPIFFHCNCGADRTGTLAFLINGFLGVNEKGLLQDFELTSFSLFGNRWRSQIENGKFTDSGVMEDDLNNYVAFGKTCRMVMKYSKTGTLQNAIENYLLLCGVDIADLNKIKNILTE